MGFVPKTNPPGLSKSVSVPLFSDKGVQRNCLPICRKVESVHRQRGCRLAVKSDGLLTCRKVTSISGCRLAVKSDERLTCRKVTSTSGCRLAVKAELQWETAPVSQKHRIGRLTSAEHLRSQARECSHFYFFDNVCFPTWKRK